MVSPPKMKFVVQCKDHGSKLYVQPGGLKMIIIGRKLPILGPPRINMPQWIVLKCCLPALEIFSYIYKNISIGQVFFQKTVWRKLFQNTRNVEYIMFKMISKVC